MDKIRSGGAESCFVGNDNIFQQLAGRHGDGERGWREVWAELVPFQLRLFARSYIEEAANQYTEIRSASPVSKLSQFQL